MKYYLRQKGKRRKRSCHHFNCLVLFWKRSQFHIYVLLLFNTAIALINLRQYTIKKLFFVFDLSSNVNSTNSLYWNDDFINIFNCISFNMQILTFRSLSLTAEWCTTACKRNVTAAPLHTVALYPKRAK